MRILMSRTVIVTNKKFCLNEEYSKLPLRRPRQMIHHFKVYDVISKKVNGT
jgi:hypothetical protein